MRNRVKNLTHTHTHHICIQIHSNLLTHYIQCLYSYCQLQTCMHAYICIHSAIVENKKPHQQSFTYCYYKSGLAHQTLCSLLSLCSLCSLCSSLLSPVYNAVCFNRNRFDANREMGVLSFISLLFLQRRVLFLRLSQQTDGRSLSPSRAQQTNGSLTTFPSDGFSSLSISSIY